MHQFSKKLLPNRFLNHLSGYTHRAGTRYKSHYVLPFYKRSRIQQNTRLLGPVIDWNGIPVNNNVFQTSLINIFVIWSQSIFCFLCKSLLLFIPIHLGNLSLSILCTVILSFLSKLCTYYMSFRSRGITATRFQQLVCVSPPLFLMLSC